MASQWNPPLPAGYEARWDPNQRAYFYINHSTKQTSWQDPRGQQQYHGGQQQHQAAANFLNQQSHQPSAGGGQNVAMTTMYKQFGNTTTRTSDSEDEDWENTDFDELFSQTRGEQTKVDIQKLHKIKQLFPSASEDTIKALLIRHKNTEVLVTNQLYNDGYKRGEHVSHPPPRANDMVERLRAMFPDANPGMVSDILVAANHDEKQARSQLEAIGFKPTFPVTHQSPARAPSPARNKSTTPPRAKSPARATSPAKPKLSEAKKREMEKKIHNQFKTFEMSVVQMALQVCDYDETRVKAVLDRIGDSSSASSRPSTSTSRPGTSTSRAWSPSPAPTPASLEPASLFDDTDPFTTRLASGMGRSSASPSRPATGKSTARVPSPKKSQPRAHHAQQRQKHATTGVGYLTSALKGLNSIICCPQPTLAGSSTVNSSGDSQSDADSRQARTVVSRQPQAFQHRTLANGPDPSLRQGPNKNLLLTEFTPAAGPNRELRQGPDRSRVQGSQGACGPDPALHCGPQYNLAMGQAQGRVMVSAI